MNTQVTKLFKLILVSLIFSLGISPTPFAAEHHSGVKYKTVTIDGLDIFYR